MLEKSKSVDTGGVLRGLAIITAFNIGGLVLHELFVPLPGAVIGLGLLATGLFSGVIKLEWVDGSASVLLQNMMLFFVPALVGAIDLFPLLGNQWLAFLLSVVVSLVTVLIVTGVSATWLGRFLKPKHSSSDLHGLE